jgi:hypothetical protein
MTAAQTGGVVGRRSGSNVANRVRRGCGLILAITRGYADIRRNPAIPAHPSAHEDFAGIPVDGHFDLPHRGIGRADRVAETREVDEFRVFAQIGTGRLRFVRGVGGTDYKRKAAKWRCPTGECDVSSRWIPASRLHTLIPRTTGRWKRLYSQRGSVEREFGRLKHEYGLAPIRTRKLERVRLHADLAILVRLSAALARER